MVALPPDPIEHFLTIDDLYDPAALCPFRYDFEGEWSSVGINIFIKTSDINSFFIRAQTVMACDQGGAVVIGVDYLNDYCSRDCLLWHI